MKRCILIFLFANIYCDSGPKVHIKHGTIQGKYMKTINGRIINGFLGIPYAKPPIKELRFKDTIRNEPWSDVYIADKDKAICTQKDFYTGATEVIGDEDCLYLNVYSPKQSEYINETYPVMVYIHGGGHMTGSGESSIYGPNYLLDKDIVLVVVNYRLGPLGFLSTQDDVVSGNMALKDQVMALKWVQENIDKFGGNFNSVTLFGQSSGGACVHFHVLSPLSKGLFHQAIIQSGASISPWSIAPKGEARNHAERLAKYYNCSTNTSEQIIKCLQTIDAKKIMGNMEEFFVWDIEPLIPFKPVIEHNHKNAFITDHPQQIIKKGKQNKINLIIGMTSGEGCFRAARIYSNKTQFEELIKYFDELIPIIMFYNNNVPDINNVTQQLKKFYFNNFTEHNMTDTLHGILNLYSDALFIYPIYLTYHLHLNNIKNSIYLYYFNYKGTNSFSAIYDPNHEYGVCHCDDLMYLFGIIDNKIISEKDRNVINTLTDLWTSFAINGKPTLNNKDIWKPASLNNEKLLLISNNELKMATNPLKERIMFWKTIYNKTNY